MMRLKGQVILITGAGKGAGRALALALADRKAIIAANDITPINLDPLVQEITRRGGECKAFIADVAKKVGVQTLVNSVLDDFGRIDALIQHACVKPRQKLIEMDEWDWQRTLDVNLTGAFLMMQSLARVMKVQGGGSIINIAAPAVVAESNNMQRQAAYFTSMAGLAELTRQAGAELEPEGIRVKFVENLGDEYVVDQVLGWL